MKDKIAGALKSWTIWFNGLGGTVLVALPVLQDSFPAMQPYIPHNVFQYLMGAVVAANILLRFRTTKSLADK